MVVALFPALALVSCGGSHSASSGESPDAAAACAADPGNCPVCGSDPASVTAANGTPCAPGKICVEALCAAACVIDGTTVLAGQQNPSGGACEGCDPAQSMTSWSKLDDGAYCGTGEVCIAGNCVKGCSEGAKGYPIGATEPGNLCLTCQASAGGTDWTETVAPGTVCGAGEVCFQGSCSSGCYVGGTFYSPDTPNPGNACQRCTPSSSPTAWSAGPDGSNYCMATPSTAGTCCAGACADTRQDVDNCGACGHTCPVGGGSVCTGGLCATTVVSAGGSSIALDATNVYWTDATAGTVMKAPLAGGTPAMISTGQSRPSGLVVDTTNAYWTSGTYSIASAPLGGGATTTLTTLPAANYVSPSSLAVAGGFLYYASGGGLGPMSPNTIGKLPTTGGKPTVLTSSSYNEWNLLVTATDIYWATQKGIFQLPISGGTTTTLMSGFPSGFAVDATSLYFSASTSVEKSPLAGGAATMVFPGALGSDAPGGVLVDASNVYFLDGSCAGTDVRIVAVPLGGGTPTTLAAGQTVAGFALSATDVYWITSSAILRVPK
jgi:hypothetical protein